MKFKRLMFVSCLIATGILFAGCQTAEERQAAQEIRYVEAEAQLPSGHTRLLGDDLQRHMADTTVKGESIRSPGWRYVVYRADDGTQRGVSNNGDRTSEDTGTWWIEEDRVCGKWKSWVDGKTNCSRVYTSEDRVHYINSDGKVGNVEFAVGNTDNL